MNSRRSRLISFRPMSPCLILAIITPTHIYTRAGERLSLPPSLPPSPSSLSAHIYTRAGERGALSHHVRPEALTHVLACLFLIFSCCGGPRSLSDACSTSPSRTSSPSEALSIACDLGRHHFSAEGREKEAHGDRNRLSDRCRDRGTFIRKYGRGRGGASDKRAET